MAKNDNLTDFLTDVANAIREKKGTSNLINPQNFSDEIKSIESGGGETPSSGWQPNADMKWAKSICENDVQEGFTYKVLQMISDGYVYTDIVVPSGGAVKTSDGGYYTENAKHYWDDTNARVATSHNDMKLRWLIYYYTSETPSITLLNDVMYACFDGVKFGKIFNGKRMLEYFDIINGADLSSSVTSMSSMFGGCMSLQTIPQLDTSNVTDMSSMFHICNYLEFLTMANIKVSFSISSSTKFSQETLEALIDNLVDLTGQDAQTFTMGSTNLAKVSQEKKDLATEKNWSLA